MNGRFCSYLQSFHFGTIQTFYPGRYIRVHVASNRGMSVVMQMHKRFHLMFGLLLILCH